MYQQLLELSQKLIAFDTVNPPGNELEAMVFLGQVLKKAGFEIQIQEFSEGRANLIARITSPAKKPPLCFTGHIDVVPLGKATWTKSPFGGEVEDGKLYGRGSSDMKCGVASIVLAAIAAHKKNPHELDLTLIITAGEEKGYEGAKAIVKEKILTGPVTALIVAEPTSNIPWFGHKGCLWFKAVATGLAAHGSTPELGDNAIYKVVKAIEILQSFDFQVAEHPLHGKPTLNIGTIKGGSNINSIPDHAEFTIDIRTLPDQNINELTDSLKKALQGLVELTTLSDGGAIATNPNHPWMTMIIKLFNQDPEKKQIFEFGNYVTDAGILAPALGGPPTLILGPGESAQAHKKDEYCYVKKLNESFDLFLKIMLSSK